MNNPYAEEFEERRSAPQRGVWGSEPPDPGFAPTRDIHVPQVLIVDGSAKHQYLAQIPDFSKKSSILPHKLTPSE